MLSRRGLMLIGRECGWVEGGGSLIVWRGEISFSCMGREYEVVRWRIVIEFICWHIMMA